MITVKIEGLRAINRALLRLPENVANKVLRKGAQAGAFVLRKAQRAAAPVRSKGESKRISWQKGTAKYGMMRQPGFLKKKIGARLRRKVSRRGVKVYGVGPRGDAYYGYIVERGHRVGPRPKTRKARRQEDPLTVKHVPPHPFLIPTYERMQVPIMHAIRDKLSEGIVKEGGRLGFAMKR